MNLTGVKVIFKSKIKSLPSKSGEIIEANGDKITVKFADKTASFAYPSTFEEGMLSAEDPSVQAAILKEIEELREKQRAEEEAKRKAAEEAEQERKRREDEEKAAAEEERKKAKAANSSSGAKLDIPINRVEGKPEFFIVFQSKTRLESFDSKTIWAPKLNKNGQTIPHWETLSKVRPGDFIFHYNSGNIVSVSIVTSPVEETDNPYKDPSLQEEYEKKGFLIHNDHFKLGNPVSISHLKDKLTEYSNYKRAPFNKNGNGNQGYFYWLSEDLARLIRNELLDKDPVFFAQIFPPDDDDEE